MPPRGTLLAMAIERLTVFLPCHTLDDFPTWLDEVEADDLLAAWTAAWEPCLVAAAGGPPDWASVDLPPSDDAPLVGIVPAAFADRFAGLTGCHADSRIVERLTEGDAIAAAAARAFGILPDAAGPLPGARWSADFRALGLAVLLEELLTRRMRSTPERADTGFATAVVAAARAAVAGDDEAVRTHLRECYDTLEGCRARYYPVDVWLLDLVLASAATPPATLAAALDAGVPCGLVADTALAPRLAAAPEVLERLRARIEEGRATLLGGRLGSDPLDLATPEEIAESFTAGQAAWRDVGLEPTVFARHAGGATPLLPAVLTGFGYDGLIWPLFDGTPLPDPHAALIRWEGSGGAVIDAVARPPLDARRAVSVLGLAERLGDAMDHDHVVGLTFAHFAGTAGPWHGLLQRIGSWSTVLGSFVTPTEFFRRTAGSGSLVRLEADRFPPTLPALPAPGADPVGDAIAQAEATARRLHARSAALDAALAPPPAAAAPAPTRVEVAPPPSGWRPWRSRRPAEPMLDNGLVRIALHRDTGGILSIRRPSDRSNRLSQQLAVRLAHPGRADAHDGLHYTRMQADALTVAATASGIEGVVARGQLLDASGGAVARFTQGTALVPGAAIAVVDIELELTGPLDGPPLERYAACRFAWNENDDLEVRRSLHTQSVATDRDSFTAVHYVELRPAGPRGVHTDAVTILTGGMPWHLLASPHVLDTVMLLGGGAHATTPGVVRRRLAIGVGMHGAGQAALGLLAGAGPTALVASGPPTVRLTVDAVEQVEGLPRRARIGLLESAGRSGDVRLEWAATPTAATVLDLRGRPRGDGDTAAAHVAIDGRSTVVFLRAHEWLHVEVTFAP